MKKIFLVIISINFFLISCNTVRESAGVSRKVIDEYTVVEKPPLVIPPNFDLIPPDQIQSKNIENTDSELAKEILFGLDENEAKTISDDSLIQQIVNETEEENMEDNIRENIDKEFSGEKSSKEDEKRKTHPPTPCACTKPTNQPTTTPTHSIISSRNLVFSRSMG